MFLSCRLILTLGSIVLMSLAGAHAQSLSSGENPVANSTLSDEFSFLNIQYPRSSPQPNIFSINSIAIACISGMKEEALEDYDAAVTEYEHTSRLSPADAPVRIILHAAPNAPNEKLKRSTVMWVLKTLAVDCMRVGRLHPTVFNIYFYGRPLYFGVLASDTGGGGGGGGAFPSLVLPSSSSSSWPTTTNNNSTIAVNITDPISSTPLPQNPTTPAKSEQQPNRGLDNNNDPHPTYDLTFSFHGSFHLPQIQTFTSILALLLDLARLPASTPIPHTSVQIRAFQVWIFIEDVLPEVFATRFSFQQFHAVALLEAVARWFVLRGEWREMVFEMSVVTHPPDHPEAHSPGVRMARGCVVSGVRGRRWCAGLDEDEGSSSSDQS